MTNLSVHSYVLPVHLCLKTEKSVFYSVQHLGQDTKNVPFCLFLQVQEVGCSCWDCEDKLLDHTSAKHFHSHVDSLKETVSEPKSAIYFKATFFCNTEYCFSIPFS